MKCYNCGKGKQISKTAEIAGEVRGEKFSVVSEAMVCDRCGFQVLSDQQSAAYTVAISDAYRKERGLLTSKELKHIRKGLGFSQRDFAAFLKVSIASIKRWESGLIQDEAHDQLIRLRTDLEAARQNVSELEACFGIVSPRVPSIEVSYRLCRTEVSGWEAESPSIAGVPIGPGFFQGYCGTA
jgi:putative zinc finger/helix-turn-helix YgiT family protein